MKPAIRMTDEDIGRPKMAAAAAEAQAAWHGLFDRVLQLEFDGYAGVDTDLFPRHGNAAESVPGRGADG